MAVKSRLFVGTATTKWQTLHVSITLKAHELDHYMYDFNDGHEISDKVEAVIEHMHQVCSENDKRTANMMTCMKQHCIASRYIVKYYLQVQ